MSVVVRKGELFLADLARQYFWYWEEANEEVARRFKISVDQSLEKIARQPTLGHVCHFSHRELQALRCFQVVAPFDRILIFYRVDDAGLEVWRLMHGSRDLPRRLRER